MTQRLSQEEVQKQFEARGFKLLDVYKNKNIPLNIICSCGRESTISYSSFKRGSKCFGCSGKKKKTKKQIVDTLKKEGYQLLSGEYKDAFSTFIVKCPEGHEFETFWNNWQQGRRCPTCKPKIIGDKLRSDQKEVYEYFVKEGCELLSEYKTNHKPVRYRCKCGNISKIAFANFKLGHRCQRCRSENMSGEKHPLWIKDREEAEFRKRVNHTCRAVVKRALKSTNTKKTSKTYRLLGYAPTDLREHIENHPNWETLKNGKWHLDHIFPIKAFCDYNIKDIGLINCLDNLRPIDGKENLRKSAKYNKVQFENWLLKKGVDFAGIIHRL